MIVALWWIAAGVSLMASGKASHAEIHLPAQTPECVRWAAGNVSTALSAAGIDPASAEIRVLLPEGTGNNLPASITAEEQGFSLAVSGGAVTIQAGGAVGAMYGLEELAEQIRNHAAEHATSWRQAAGSLSPTEQKPYLEVRADNMFIHTSGSSEARPPGGYPLLLNDLDMWRAYIDMLARNRYNLLDLHGAYDLESTSFPNLYPMLVHVPDYPNVGDESAQSRNLASLQAIVKYARARGIRVALMNYSANNGRGGQYKNEPSVTGVPPERLADYTAKAVALLIRDLPHLYMLGFRVGESTQPASFYQDAYLKGIQMANRPDLRVYTRSWQTTKSQLVPIARAAHHGFDIEIKFNGEHLGLPYQSMQGARYGSYSYQDYLDVPADYRILWQVRANGTHRFWAWENTEFIRRTVESCRLGNALGFTLEPPVAYFSVYPDQYYRSAEDIHVYRYIWQKHWMWYYAWGRLGYDPHLPESDLIREFQRHYGAAGAKAYDSMQQSSQVVPLVYAYRFQGPDQRDFSPETETGNFDTKKKRARQDLLQFAENRPEDNRSFAGIDEYVSDRIAGDPDGRIGPFTVAERLTDAAARARAILASAPAPPAAEEAAWRLLRTDLLAATELGDYYAARIRGMSYLDYALRTGNSVDYRIAVADLGASRHAWNSLSQITDSVYRPLSNPLRHQIGFQWSSQNEPLARLDATAGDFWQKHGTESARLLLASGSRVHFGGVTLTAQQRNAETTIQCAAGDPGSVASAVLWWKPLPSELAWQSMPMRRDSGANGTAHWQATIPLDARGLMYLVELRSSNGNARNTPDVLQQTPWRIISPIPAKPKESANAPR